ncbi:patatin-like protein [Pacificimonas flava]|uniref:PNPLA domain-containing protein n=1 Tax=Pacificimonas flava TaxID=1234595 RepID=M2TNV0_9SPHN|nr:patatin-like protein [Pacificimonas flava]EMD83406.1 hypothetical protein C725_1307 [Pacificimonas flava]MBB5279032.1 patatin-related protein [Pacificimonas flava]
MREKELRLALVCYGGISLAVYMHGITREIWKLLRASRRLAAGEPRPAGDTEAVYHDMLSRVHEHVRLRVLADIVAGASAGGINGIFLAEAISTGASLDPLVDLWLERADVDELLDPDAAPSSRFSKIYAEPFLYFLRQTRSVDFTEEVVEGGARDELNDKLSRFVRSRWFKPPFSGVQFSNFLLDALSAMHETAPADAAPLLPEGQPLDLFVTVTDFYGHEQRLRLNSPPYVEETEHRKIIAFRDEGRRGTRRRLADPASLAFAARATASFPGAFPPFQAREMDAVVKARGDAWPQRSDFLAAVFPLRKDEDAQSGAALLDGSILNNAPFRPALGALRNRPAQREIDRRFVYIDPKPGIRSIGGKRVGPGEPPGFFTTIIQSLSDIPREQPIRDDLEALEGFSRRVKRTRHVLSGIAASTDAEIEDAIGARTLVSRPSLAKLQSLRAEANAAAVARAGYAYPGYAHLKLADIVESMARLFSAIGGHDDVAAVDDVRRSLWAWVGAENFDEITRTIKPKLAAQDNFVGFLQRYDLGFRIRRLRYVVRQLNTLIDESGDAEVRAAGERTKAAMFEVLAPFIARRSDSHFDERLHRAAAALPSEPAKAADLYGEALDLSALDEETERRLSVILRSSSSPEAVRRTLLGAYLGFAFYDIATFPMLQGEGLDEYDEVKIDRISPDDATFVRDGGTMATLKGIRFNSFGAFFSRAYRENDYLWGRLHGAERLIDIVLSTLPADAALPAEEVAGLKRAACRAVLDAEEERLTAIPDLLAQLRQEVG